jgi:hypothetical protein
MRPPCDGGRWLSQDGMKRDQEDRQRRVERFVVNLATRKSQMRSPCMLQVKADSYAGMASRIGHRLKMVE